jgi:hypothetical protein
MRVLVAETARQTADMTAAKARAQTTQLEKELAQRTSIRSDPAISTTPTKNISTRRSSAVPTPS